MNRIEERLASLKEKNEKALITYMTAGLPSLEGTAEVIKAQTEAGVDIIELGIPFSDPIADGPVIQDASYRSIQLGTTLKDCFHIVNKVRQENCNVPIVFMMYYNTIHYYGIDHFVDDCIAVGVDGLIIPDLPMEEQDVIKDALQKREAPVLIQLVAPVSKQRIPEIVQDAKGFVYCVSSMGVTGQKAEFHKDVKDYLQAVKVVSAIPTMMGFGIRNASDVAELKDYIDGCIVGSYFITLMEEHNYDLEVIKEYISTFKKELNNAV